MTGMRRMAWPDSGLEAAVEGRWRSVCLVMLLALALVSGCQPSGTAVPPEREQGDTAPSRSSLPSRATLSDKSPIAIVTTCGMVTDIVRQVAGDRAQVTGLLGEGVDPHLYKPTRNDVKRLLDSDMVFYSGLLLEGRMSDTFAKIARSGKPVFAVTEGIDEKFLLEPPEFHGHFDPHVWMDVQAWSQCVQFTAQTLAEVDPAHAAQYLRSAAAYRTELQQLDDYARQCVASIPPAQRVLVTAHDAFGYFARAYGIEVRSVQGISTESQAGVDDINRLVSFLVERKVPAIFVESSVSEKNIRAIVEGASQRGSTVSIGGELYSDAMGPAGSYEGTYVGMIDHNVTVVTRALGGSAPKLGLHAKLNL